MLLFQLQIAFALYLIYHAAVVCSSFHLVVWSYFSSFVSLTYKMKAGETNDPVEFSLSQSTRWLYLTIIMQTGENDIYAYKDATLVFLHVKNIYICLGSKLTRY